VGLVLNAAATSRPRLLAKIAVKGMPMASVPDESKPHIAAIGASAGGVKALQVLFETLPKDTGLAFVVIVHLDPARESELANILGSKTKMPVIPVAGDTPLEADHVYVIPPNRRLHITDHTVSTLPFDEAHGLRAPIDLFFRSLAQQHGDGFAVILTGAGSDGSSGVKAVKEAGGIILVQDPAEAEYPSMPSSAIATGVADFILPVRGIAQQLVELARNKHAVLKRLRESDEEQVRRILAHVRVRTGHDFSKYKKSTLLRRLARRMQVTRQESLADYYDYLRRNAEESQALFNDLLISVTHFFRDNSAFEILARDVIPQVFRGDGNQIRVWIPGCATGEEAYSLAMLLLEEAAKQEARPEIQVFASDLDPGALATAREGVFPVAIEADVSDERLRRFFTREGDFFRVKRDLRDVILFASHSLLRDPPFSRIDLISCRNLLIYLDRELQQQAANTFHYSLNPGGYLFLGSAESVDGYQSLFRVINREARIYQATGEMAGKFPIPPRLLASPVPSEAQFARTFARVSPIGASEVAAHRQALEKWAQPSALVDIDYRLVHLSENASRYLLPSAGPLTPDITELVRPELRFDLRAALARAFERQQPTLSLPILVRFNGAFHRVYLQVRPVMRDAAAPRQALVFFIEGDAVEQSAETATSERGEQRTAEDTIRQLREELQLTQSRLRAMREDSEAANEELRAANEELQSINEEYRSTSEELETSKEELQSINEELQTVNNELKIKLEGVSRAHSDLQNLMAATDFGILFLDPSLRIKRFTPRVTDLFNIKSSDEGRPITDFTNHLEYGEFTADAEAVLKHLLPIERQVHARSGGWYQMRLRPYRTVDDKIDGVVVSFVDVSERHKIEQALRHSEENLRKLRAEKGQLS
jgi:two-component system, chemotaxis family, CheB/CheR fusion protein